MFFKSETFVILSYLLVTSLFSTNGKKCLLKSRKPGHCVKEEDCDQEPNLNSTSVHCENQEMIRSVCCPLSKSEIMCLKYYNETSDNFHSNTSNSISPEFFHMAAVGYGDENNIDWLCSGSLISEQFILTAAHCVRSKKNPPKFIRLGDINLNDTTDDTNSQNFVVSKIFFPATHRKVSHYHDIALIYLDRPVNFTTYIQPVCLQTNNLDIPNDLTVSGWGKEHFLGLPNQRLRKLTLYKTDYELCKKRFASVPKRKLSQGIIDEMQLCAGHPEGRDTCTGDSGGPIQYLVENSNVKYFRVVGVTSFGNACGFTNSIGVYTRVSNYTKWIEDIVWPDEE